MRGALAQVKEAVRAIKQVTREVFVPLVHRPGEAQADFGHGLVRERGALRKVVFFVMALPCKVQGLDNSFVRAVVIEEK